MVIESTNNPTAMLVMSSVTLVFCVGVLVYNIYKIVKTKRNPLKEDLFTDLKAYRHNIESNGLG